MTDIQNIRERAESVKNATQIGENTAERVGGVLVDSIDAIAGQATELAKKADKTDVANSLNEINKAIAAKADAAATYKSIGDINVELAKKADKTDLDKHENAYTGDYLAVPDFALDESVSQLVGNDRYQAVKNIGNAWLDGIAFDMQTDTKYIGRCKLSWDGINVECYNYICSWADHIGVQQLTGAVRIGEDGKAEVGTTQNVLFRTYQEGAWGAWQSYDTERLADPTRQIESINTTELDACKDDFAAFWWKEKRPVVYRLMLTQGIQNHYAQCIGTLLMWVDGSTTWLHQAIFGSFGVNSDGSPSWVTGSGLRTFRIFHRGYIRDSADWDAWQEVGGTGVTGRLDTMYTGFENMSKAVTQILQSETDREKAETLRINAERQRVTAEQSRATAEADRTKAELLREAAERKRVTAEQTRTETFNQQTASITTALRNAETATEGAEKVNVELLSDSIRVTDRDGKTAELQVTTPQELVTVTIESQVEGLGVEGIKVNVFLNNGKTPQTYTTNAQGEVSFAVDKGNYYEVAVPEYATAQPISPEGYTAVVHQRSILLIYKPYDVDTSEKVIVTVTKYTDGAGVKWEGKVVKIAYDGKTTEYKCDKNGQVATYIPYLKEYTITVDDEDGYLVRFKRNTRTYVAKVAQRLVDITMYQFKTGIFILDKDGNEYYLDEWTGDGKQPDEAVAIKIADQQLQQNRGSFLLRVSDLKDMTKLASAQWCTQNLQFTSIALNGNTSSDPNYWNGEQSSFLVMQEAEERSLSVPAFSKAKTETLEIGGRALEGFLMSVGQEYVHISNAGVVRDILTALFGEDVGGNYYKFVFNNYRWTSTQDIATNAWLYASQASNYIKSNSFRVLPSFAC